MRWRGDFPRCGTAASLPRCRRPGDDRRLRVFKDEIARRDHSGEFRIAKLAKETLQIPIDRLLPHLLPRPKRSTNESRMDPVIQRRREKPYSATSAVSRYADFRIRREQRCATPP
jgi:hypothetical protein